MDMLSPRHPVLSTAIASRSTILAPRSITVLQDVYTDGDVWQRCRQMASVVCTLPGSGRGM